jgi:hypothetical protein
MPSARTLAPFADIAGSCSGSRSHTPQFVVRLVYFYNTPRAAMILLRQTRCALNRRRHIACFHTSPAWWAARKVLQRFKLADIGEGITECEVIRWYVPCRCIPQEKREGGGGASIFPSSYARYFIHRLTPPTLVIQECISSIFHRCF